MNIDIRVNIIRIKQYTIIIIATNHAKTWHKLNLLFFPPVTIHVSSNNDKPTGIIDINNTKNTTPTLFSKGISLLVNNIAIQITTIAEKIAIAAYLDCEAPIK